jgi:hypothetical protein
MTIKNTQDLIDRFTTLHGSGRKAGPALGITQQQFNEWGDGEHFPTEERMQAMALAVGVDPALALVVLRRDRAKTEEARSTWQRVYKALSKAAAVSAVAVGISAAPTPSPAASNASPACVLCKPARRWFFPLFPESDDLAL